MSRFYPTFLQNNVTEYKGRTQIGLRTMEQYKHCWLCDH